jgi:hypothetical protein
MTGPQPARFRWRHLVAGLPGAAICGALAAWIAVTVGQKFAPWLLFPLLVGAVLGMVLVALARMGQVGHRPTALLLTLVAAGAAILGQHWLSYRDALQRSQEESKQFQKARQLAPLFLEGRPLDPPGSLTEFLRWQAARGRPIGRYTARDATAWLSWGLDGLLLLGASLAVAVPALRQPYCDRCASWFRTMRRGQLDRTTAAQLAATVGAALPEGFQSAQYRLVACNGGCGPTGLELSWEAGKPLRIWLDAEGRNRVLHILDPQ